VKADKLYLVGFMAAGKTTLARALARRLDWRAVDIDELIEQREHATVAEIFAKRAEPYFFGIDEIYIPLTTPASHTPPAVCAVFGDEPFIKRLVLKELRRLVVGDDADLPVAMYDCEDRLPDWRDVAGTKMPFHLFYTLNGMTICDMTYRDVVANPQIPQNAFDIPADQLAKAAKPADPRITPFHWAIRRTYSAFYMDVDNQYGDEGTKPTIVDIGPYISETQGWTHNTVYIDMGPYLVAMEAPNDDGQSIAHLALKKQKYGDKPIKYLVLSHHHVDHVGGMRQFIGEGATVVVGKGDGDYFRRALARPQTQNWNAPDKSKPYNPVVIENTGKWSIKEGNRELDFYMIDNPHADDMQMGWLPDLKLGLVTDIWNPGPPVTSSNPNLASVVHAVDKLGLKPTKFAGGHGSVGDYAQAEKIVKAAEKK
jgi:glyoxylase-like metal-dependent hydrolase (beta-lactamase superfamily II)